jgi:putative hydrolase of the HAD superfamily
MDVALWNRFDQRILTWVRRLRESGYRTAILSNLPRPLGESLRARPGFLEHFDHVTFSYELGLVKPQPEIYEHAVDGLRVSAGETLFLDDRPNNIEGAAEAGLHAFLYRDWDGFLAADPATRYGLPEPAGVDPAARRQ